MKEESSGKQQNILGVMVRQWRAIAGRALRDVAAEIGAKIEALLKDVPRVLAMAAEQLAEVA